MYGSDDVSRPSASSPTTEARTVPLCGNSIGTDRRFLARHLPEIEDHLHYRCVDVSTIKELARRWYPDVARGAKEAEGRHRARVAGVVHVQRGLALSCPLRSRNRTYLPRVPDGKANVRGPVAAGSASPAAS